MGAFCTKSIRIWGWFQQSDILWGSPLRLDHDSHLILKTFCNLVLVYCKVEKIWEDSLDLIPSPLPSVKIQIIGGKVYLRWYGKTLLGDLLTSARNVLPLYLKQIFLPIIWMWRWWDCSSINLAKQDQYIDPTLSAVRTTWKARFKVILGYLLIEQCLALLTCLVCF